MKYLDLYSSSGHNSGAFTVSYFPISVPFFFFLKIEQYNIAFLLHIHFLFVTWKKNLINNKVTPLYFKP